MGYMQMLEAIRAGAEIGPELGALQAEAALVAADWPEAAAVAAKVLSRPAPPPVRADALRVLALARARQGDPDVWPLLREALALADTAPMREAREEAAWLSGRTNVMPALDVPGVYGTALPAGDRCPELLRAFHALRAIGAHGAARAVGRRLSTRGVRNLPRTARSPRPAGLTPREVEVAALLSQGLRNGEISQRLVISTKTVDHHVSAILRKLDVPTRTAAANCLRLAA